jgi:hypothetical protein
VWPGGSGPVLLNLSVFLPVTPELRSVHQGPVQHPGLILATSMSVCCLSLPAPWKPPKRHTGSSPQAPRLGPRKPSCKLAWVMPVLPPQGPGLDLT